MVRRAAVFGCNYAGSAHALHGCINDAHAIYEMLVYAYQFDPQVSTCWFLCFGPSALPQTRGMPARHMVLVVGQ